MVARNYGLDMVFKSEMRPSEVKLINFFPKYRDRLIHLFALLLFLRPAAFEVSLDVRGGRELKEWPCRVWRRLEGRS